ERMPGGVPIEVPRTDPLVLHVVWHDGVADRLEPVRLRAGEIQRVRVPAKTLELRTLLGARFGLRPSDTREPETPSGLDFTSLRARHSPFFGRENEIGHLRQTMSLRSNGWILLTGPTGVGKSAVLCRLLDLLEREGAPVLMHFLEGGPARWAKTKIVEDSLRAQA